MDPLEQSTTAAAPTDRLMGRLIDFETVADASAATAGDQAGDTSSGTDAAAGAADAAASGAGAATGETDASAVATGAASAWSPEQLRGDPAFLDLVAQEAGQIAEARIAPLLQLLEQNLTGGGDAGQQQAGQQGATLLSPDPFSDNYAQEFAAYQQSRDEQMFSRFEAMLGQIAQPLNQRIESETVAEGEQRLKDMLADDVARHGEFPRMPGETTSKAESLVRPLAQALFPQVAQRFGNGPRAAEVAMSQAAQTVREIVAEAGAAALEAERNRTATLAGARTDVAAGAAGAQVVGEIRARTIEEGLSAVTARHAAGLRNGQ